MTTTSVNRRSEVRQRKVLGPQLELTVLGSHPAKRVRGRVSDVSPGGFGIACADELQPGEKVAFFDPVTAEQREGRVVWCKPAPPGDFKAGITFKPDSTGGRKTAPDGEAARGPESDEPDYYEMMQVNPKAEPETIHRIYRLLAQRLHPDNQETGNDAEFRQLLKAYRILSDPEQRASYDVRLKAQQRERQKLAQAAHIEGSPKSEKEKRHAILSLLYTKRIQDPHAPGVQLPEFEEVIGVAREHLEFSMWYLRESGMLARADNGRFVITVRGVDWVEAANGDGMADLDSWNHGFADGGPGQRAIQKIPRSRRLESGGSPEAR